MKHLITTLMLSVSAAALAQESPDPPAPTKGTYVLRGLHCQPCTTTVAGSLKKVPGVQAVKVDWATKNAWIDFDERVISAQGLAQRIAATPHMMGRNMHYSGVLALKVPDLADNAAAAKAVDALKQISGVAKVTPYPKQHSLTVEFDSRGNVTSGQLIEALATAGMAASSYR